MTTAQVFANYLGLTPANAPWAYTAECPICLNAALPGGGSSDYECCYGHQFDEPRMMLTATSPLAPEPTPGWLEALVRHERFWGLRKNTNTKLYTAEFKTTEAHACDFVFVNRPNDVLATALAFMSADPALRSACERAADYNEKESQ